jgi:hypothetical protein
MISAMSGFFSGNFGDCIYCLKIKPAWDQCRIGEQQSQANLDDNRLGRLLDNYRAARFEAAMRALMPTMLGEGETRLVRCHTLRTGPGY